MIPSHRCHLRTALNWNIKQQRRPNNVFIRPWTGTNFLFSTVGKSHRRQSHVLGRTCRECSWRRSGRCPWVLAWGSEVNTLTCREIRLGMLRPDSSLSVIKCLCLLISHWGGFSMMRNELHRISRDLLWANTHILKPVNTFRDYIHIRALSEEPFKILHLYLWRNLTPSLLLTSHPNAEATWEEIWVNFGGLLAFSGSWHSSAELRCYMLSW